MIAVVQGLAEVLERGKVVQITAGTMTDVEQGYSGAALRRVEVEYENRLTETVILKEAERKERLAMRTLTEQGHRNTPAAFSLDTETDTPRWMAIEDVGRVKTPPPGFDWTPRIADAMARIHARNLQRGAEMPWLPHADSAYWQHLVRQISVDHVERMMAVNPAFHSEFGAYLPDLREKAQAFAREMDALYAEKDSLTLTHGDLQTVDGAHIHYVDDKPVIIDFGWCHYAPFYVDLASFFDQEGAKLYYNALTAQGVTLRYDDFYERLRAAFRYSGLIYLFPSLLQWRNGPTERTGKRLLQMLTTVLTGEFPERRINYSNALFAKLVHEHRNGVLGKL